MVGPQMTLCTNGKMLTLSRLCQAFIFQGDDQYEDEHDRDEEDHGEDNGEDNREEDKGVDDHDEDDHIG